MSSAALQSDQLYREKSEDRAGISRCGRHTTCITPRARRRVADLSNGELTYFGGGGVKISRLRPGSGFGFGLGAFLVSFLPLSLFPMQASMTQ
jgi:hypothetical protein